MESTKALIERLQKEYEKIFDQPLTAGALAKFAEELIARRRGKWVLDSLESEIVAGRTNSEDIIPALKAFQEEAEKVNKEFWKNNYTTQFEAALLNGDHEMARVIANNHLTRKYNTEEENKELAKKLGGNWVYAHGKIMTKAELEIIEKAAANSKQ